MIASRSGLEHSLYSRTPHHNRSRIKALLTSDVFREESALSSMVGGSSVWSSGEPQNVRSETSAPSADKQGSEGSAPYVPVVRRSPSLYSPLIWVAMVL